MPPICRFVAIASTCLVLRGQTYSQLIDSLDPSNPRSVCSARDGFLQKRFSSSEDRTTAFRAFWRFYRNSIRASDQAFGNAQNPADPELVEALETGEEGRFVALRREHPETWNRIRDWVECDFAFETDSGTEFGLWEKVSLLVSLSREVNDELRQFVAFYARENEHPIIGDGELTLSWDELRQRIVRWEDFARGHPSLVESSVQVEAELKDDIHSYLFEPYETDNRLSDEARMSYENLVQQNTTSRIYPLLRDVVANLKLHDYKINRDLIDLFKAHGLDAEQLAGQHPENRKGKRTKTKR